MNEPPHVPPRDSYNRTANRNPTTRTCCHSNRLTSRGRQAIPRRHQEEQLRYPMELSRDLPIGRRAVVVIRPLHKHVPFVRLFPTPRPSEERVFQSGECFSAGFLASGFGPLVSNGIPLFS